MGTQLVCDYEGGAEGATLTGTGFTKVGTGPLIHTASEAVVGSMGAQATSTVGAVTVARHTAPVASLVMAFSTYVDTPSTVPDADYTIAALRATVIATRVIYTAAGALGVQGVSGGFHSMATGVPLGTKVRVELLVTVATATTGTITAKFYTSAGGWTTQLGTTFTSAAYDAGTAVITGADVGADSGQTTVQTIGFDYTRMEDGRTTEFGPPPAASAPSVNAGADQNVLAGTTINLTSTESGTFSSATWSATEIPPGAASPSIANPAAASTTVQVATGGHYVFRRRLVWSGGNQDDTMTVYVYEQSNVSVKVYSVTSSVFTNEGGAASLTLALNDLLPATYAQSPTDPVAALLTAVMNPYGPGSISVFVEGYYTSAVIHRTVTVYKADGTTVLATATYDLGPAVAEREIALDSTALAAIPALSDRQALVVKVSDSV